MAGPYTRSYSPGGGVIVAGRFLGGFSGSLNLNSDAASSSLVGAYTPAWKIGKPLNEWFQISGTALMGSGSQADEFCGMALVESGGRAIAVLTAAGGHSNAADNRVVACDLMTDSPSWLPVRHAASSSVQPDVAYYSDGRPSSRHYYWNCHHVPSLDRVIMVGGPVVYGSGIGKLKVDGFNLATNQWDGVVPDQPGVSGSGYADCSIVMTNAVLNPSTGDIWSWGNFYNIYKWSASTRTQSLVASYGTQFKGPGAWDETRDKLVFIGYPSGGAMVDGWIVAANGLSRTPLTFNASAAYTSWVAAQGNETGNIVYDPLRDRFYWFNCNAGGAVYILTPNTGAPWDVSILTQGSGSTPPPSGLYTYSRFRYVRALDGLVFFPANGATFLQNGYFMRLS